MNCSYNTPDNRDALCMGIQSEMGQFREVLNDLSLIEARTPNLLFPERLQNKRHRHRLSQDGRERQSVYCENLTNVSDQVDTRPPITILVVEDEMIVALDLQHALERMGYTVVGIACSGEEAIQQVSNCRPDVIMMDIQLRGDMDGIEAAKRIGTLYEAAIIYLTAQADECTVQRVKDTGPVDLLFKPYSELALHATIEDAVNLLND